jgi:hypothetical protein
MPTDSALKQAEKLGPVALGRPVLRR